MLYSHVLFYLTVLLSTTNLLKLIMAINFTFKNFVYFDLSISRKIQHPNEYNIIYLVAPTETVDINIKLCM